LPDVLPDWFIDSLLLNPHLVPRSEEVNLSDFRRDRGRNGDFTSELALVPLAPSTEQGTIPGLPPPIHAKCRYFVIRSMNVRNIQISAAKGIWASSIGNTQRLRQAYRDVDHVILIFSATETRNFQGYGKMTCEPDELLFPGIWGDLSCRLSANFRVHWIKQCTVPLAQADHIKNPQNEDLPVRRCRDGQELPSSVGERLCRFLWQQADADLLKGSELEFEPRVSYDVFPPPLARDLEVGANGRRGGVEANAGAPLAIEDVKKDARSQEDDERARPAPVPLGTFNQEQKVWGCGHAAVSVGKALASGSSSLLAAVAEDAKRHGQPPPGHWPQPVNWHPGLPPAEWQQAARYQHPSGYYPAVGYASYNYGYGGPCGTAGFPEVRPPGFWGSPAPATGERSHFTQPPSSWEGASSGPIPVGNSKGHCRSRSRARRGKHRRRR